MSNFTFRPVETKVSEYIIWYFQEHGEPLTNLKLQKLLYYAQGWHLALYDKPLFDSPIEAWVHGPVAPDFYHEYKKYKHQPITKQQTKPDLDKIISEHLEEVINEYGSYSAFQLENLTHHSDPWKNARGNTPIDAPSRAKISIEDMKIWFKKKMEENEKEKNQR
ncbi:MAG TPA: type II toxin-antitoxin system antitoxin SocA domain-containing protein [Gammaproteobacteria bacterium]|nr:type II toxin-antitoxin system antitoxin SocA domain-containing protein [Gammaproteobacteria bacterium]